MWSRKVNIKAFYQNIGMYHVYFTMEQMQFFLMLILVN